MKKDLPIAELHEVLDPVADIRITQEADEVSVIINKPVDIEAVDQAISRALHAEPLDRFERSDSWRIRLLKRDRSRSGDQRYQAVRVIDSYYEYRPQM